MEKLTKREMFLISEGLIALIRNACDARALICDRNTLDAISNHLEELRQLNTKICMMAPDDAEDAE